MIWTFGAIVAVILLWHWINDPSRTARRCALAALNAGRRFDWTTAAWLCTEGHRVAGKLKGTARSAMEARIEIEWARILHRQGQLGAAAEMIERGLSKAERHFGPHGEILLVGYRYSGDLFTDLGRHVDAEAQYRKALDGHESNSDTAGIISTSSA